LPKRPEFKIVNKTQALFGIIQGSTFFDLPRSEALPDWQKTGFDGYAIGGLSVGEEKPAMFEVVFAHRLQ